MDNDNPTNANLEQNAGNQNPENKNVQSKDTQGVTTDNKVSENKVDVKDPFNARGEKPNVDLDDEDKEKIGNLVKSEISSSEERINRQVELNNFFQSDFGKKIADKGLEAKVREYAMSENLMGLKLQNSIYAILGDTALQIGAELEREANTQSNNNNVGGGRANQSNTGKSAYEMSPEEWEKHKMETRKGNLRRQEVPNNY